MPDIFNLIDVLCEAYDLGCRSDQWGGVPPFKPRDGKTFCNQAVFFVANKLGYKGFKVDMLANQMIDLMAKSKDWTKLEMGNAQKMANTGALVIACQADKPHGHVAAVRPGRDVYSGNWKQPAPRLMNIGADNFIAKSANYVFRDIPTFYVWNEGRP